MADRTDRPENGYDGPERRRDYLQLDQALDEVDKLHGAVSTLATAVVNTAPRKELEDLRAEVKRDFLVKVYLQLGLTVAFVIFFIAFISLKLSALDHSIGRGHEVIICLQGKSEAARTGDNSTSARLLCQQSTKGVP